MANPSMESIYGPGLNARLSGRSNGMDDPDAIDEDELEPQMMGVGAHGPMLLGLRKRRQSAILKQILKAGGYGDLAKLTNFHKVSE